MPLDIRAILAKKKQETVAASAVVPELEAIAKIELSSPCFDSVLDMELDAVPNQIPINLEEGEIDPRVKLLSHSSRTMLHTCPRKYQLYRKSAVTVEDENKEDESKVTFAFGHAVGIGVQSTLENKTPNQIILDTFLGWDADLLLETPRQAKSFWLAMHAVQRLIELREQGILGEYELVYYQGRPAVELSFIIHLPNGFKYRGFVDAVLRHKVTGEILVLEVKTTSGQAMPASYRNSGQAVGYSVILDILFPALSSYEVLYFIYETKKFDYVQMPFKKSLLQRALWLQELLLDCKAIELYEEYEIYPMYGENCYSFFRDCEYLTLCTMSTENLTKPLTQKWLDDSAEAEKEYQFSVTFDELVQKQIEKGDY